MAAKALTYKCHALFAWRQRGPRESQADRRIEGFLEIDTVVRELESGRYPACEWVDHASRLFWSALPHETPRTKEQIQKLLDAYKEFARTHTEPGGYLSLEGGIVYLVSTKMRELVALRGNSQDPLEEALAEFESSGVDSLTSRYTRASCYLSVLRRAPTDSVLASKCAELLTRLASESDGLYSGRALSNLGALCFKRGEFRRSRDYFLEFVTRFPESPYAWIAALRVGQCEELLGNIPDALSRYRSAALNYEGNPLAAVLCRAHVAHCLESQGAFKDALGAYRLALGAWDNDYDAYSVYILDQNKDLGVWFGRVGRILKTDLQVRVEQLEKSTTMLGGDALECGRALLAEERWREAHSALGFANGENFSPEIVTEARYLDHIARLEMALERARMGESVVARKELLSIAKDPHDVGVSLAKIAVACLELNKGKREQADFLMAEALRDWHVGQKKRSMGNPTSLEQGVLGIRNLFFQDPPDSLVGRSRWNARLGYSPYSLVSSSILVQLANRDIVQVRVPDSIARVDNALFIDKGQLTCLEHIITALGGTKKRAPIAVMEPPNQPVGDSRTIAEFWNGFFPCRPGHWMGWEFEARPVITKITFENDTCTLARVAVTDGYTGATFLLEKIGNSWVAKGVTNQWIT